MDHRSVEAAAWGLFGIGCVVALCFGIKEHNDYHLELRKSAFENGYSQQSLPGQSTVYWVKDGTSVELAEIEVEE